MPSKSVPVSVRISQEDAAFLARLQIDDAITPSEKIRAILKDTRIRAETGKDYQSCQQQAAALLNPVLMHVQMLEAEGGSHSELVTLFIEWLSESLAMTMAAEGTLESTEDLEKFEQNVAERSFRLFEAIMRMAVTASAPCYDAKLIRSKVLPILELSNIVEKVDSSTLINNS